MLRPVLVLTGLLCLACAGGKDKDTTTDEGGLDQSAACSDYLDCAAAVDPTTFAALGSTYGPDGDCWSQGEAFADACTSACEAAITALAAAYPDAAECAGYAPEGCPIDAGEYELTLLEGDGGTCKTSGDLPGTALVTCCRPPASPVPATA